MEITSINSLRALATDALSGRENGSPLDPLSRSLISLGLATSCTALDRAAMNAAIDAALDSGASVDQIEEVIALVSGLGVHSLMTSQAAVLDAARARGLLGDDGPLDPDRQKLWDKYVGDDPFWIGFERELPGFLKSMLILSPDIFTAFFAYCAVPWKIGKVRAVTKELIAMASDASPTHIYGPGFRIHLGNAIALGASRAQIGEALDLAAAAPHHRGVA
jgi:alkylhydroperoxidase/carboxymuconolactone decarboxylase family protein YurZ